MKFLLVTISLLLVSQEISAGFKKFYHGTRNGGNVFAPEVDRQSKATLTGWYNQSLDHFNAANPTKWAQRYFVNDQFFTDGGAAFIMLGGEGEASPTWVQYGSMFDYARETNAIIFELEHRFYGESKPTEDLSVDNLKYLSSEQALADAATFIEYANKEYNLTNTRWIAFGGSYSGSLAAWLRLKYPHLVWGAVSTSGPILAQVDFIGYYQVVSESLGTYSDACVATVKDAYANITALIQDSAGRRVLDETFNTCESLDDYADQPKYLQNFQGSIAESFAGVVQYNKIQSGPTIDTLCDILVDETAGTPLDRLVQVVQLIDGDGCFDYNYAELVEFFQNTSWDSEAAQTYRPWIYQTCVEFGYYQTSNQEGHVFGDGFPVEFFVEQCKDIYGDNFVEDIVYAGTDFTNAVYGGLDIAVSNVVFVHGSIDPWHALGLLETRTPEAPAIYIQGTAHCANMYAVNESEEPELYAAVQEIGDLVQEWLAQ